LCPYLCNKSAYLECSSIWVPVHCAKLEFRKASYAIKSFCLICDWKSQVAISSSTRKPLIQNQAIDTCDLEAFKDWSAVNASSLEQLHPSIELTVNRIRTRNRNLTTQWVPHPPS